MNGAPASSVGTVNTRGSGYIDNNLFLRWMHLFVDTVGCKKTTPHLLLLDGHASHKTLDVILYARENGVVILTFPLHCTNRLQPLDRTFFRSLKAEYSRAVDNWMICIKHRPVTQFDVIPRTKRRPASQLTRSERPDYGHLTTPNSTKNYWPPPLYNLPSSLLRVLASLVCMSPLISTGKMKTPSCPLRWMSSLICMSPLIPTEKLRLKACSPTSIVSAPGKTRTRVRVTSAVMTSSPYKNMMEDTIAAKATTSAIRKEERNQFARCLLTS